MKPVKRRRKASKFKPKDHISNMPDNVVTHILNRLPLQDAVRTGILSREWRFKWTMLSELVFDEKFFGYLSRKESDKNHGRIISRLLLHFKGAITKFVIYLFNDGYEIEQWILFLSKKRVKDLTVVKWSDEPLELPTHLFSCLELEHLKLDYCYFDPPASFHGFPNLVSLELSEIEFKSGKLSDLFTPCPILQILNMGIAIFYVYETVKIVEIAKLTNLKILTLFIHNLDDTEITSSSSIFELVGFLPKLQELHLDFKDCECEPFTEYDARNRPPSTFPCLKRLKLSNIDLGSGIVLSFAFELIRSSPNLQSLEITAGASDVDLSSAILSAESFTKDGARNRSLSTFPCLKTLKLSKIDLGSGIVLSFAFEIIMSSPNLQTLEITAGASVVDPPAAILSPEYFIDDATKRSPTTSPCLKAIKLPLVSGIMLSFASKIIWSSPSLQTLEIIVGDWDDDSPPTICSPESFTKGDARKKSKNTPTTFPCLETLKLSNIDLSSGIMLSFVFQMITSSPSLQTLEITSGDMSCNKDGARKRSPTTFPCLKTLKLLEIDLGSGTMLSFAFKIIRSSPNLQTLEITAGDWGVESSRAICSPEVDYNATGVLQLRSVVFRDLKGTKNEISWIKYLLACSPSLKRIRIRLLPSLDGDQKYKFARKLLKLHRASPVVDIDLY